MELNEYFVNTFISCAVLLSFVVCLVIAVFFICLYVYKFSIQREEKTKRITITEEKENDIK